MATEISLLVPEFRNPLLEVIQAGKNRGYRFEVVKTLLTPKEQASLWKQGRTKTDAELKALALENANAPFLAQAMRSGKANTTNIVTDHVPGFSWFQWGEAATVVWVDKTNKVILNDEKTEYPTNINGYTILAEECEKHGLTHGYKLESKDFTLVQLRPQSAPRECYTVEQINEEMAKRFHV